MIASQFSKNLRRNLRSKSFVGSVVGAVLALMAFPEKVQHAYAVATDAVMKLSRPLFHFRFQSKTERTAAAENLLVQLHKGEAVCVLQPISADLAESGWRADLIISYVFRPPREECGSFEAIPYIAAFTPRGFSLHYAGGGGGRDMDGFPSTIQAEGRFVLQTFTGTDWPFIQVWYMHDGRFVRGESVSIHLADAAENQYDLRVKGLAGGLLIWGTPDGVFHLLVSSDGKLVRGAGLPPSIARTDVFAVSLFWDGSTFRVPPSSLGEHSFVPADREAWQEFTGVRKLDGKVHSLVLRPLAHLYVAGCKPVSGFVEAGANDFTPGAIVPRFDASPVLRCGGTNSEGDTVDVPVTKE